MYRPKEPFTVVAELYQSEKKIVKGVATKVYTKVCDLNCSFRTYGGTEKADNDVLVVFDTAVVETWYNPAIKSSGMIVVNGAKYEILGEPENISMRNQYMRFKVKSVKGGV